MQSEDFLAAALRALADQDRGREAPGAVEARLVRAFRQKQARRRWRNGAGWFLAAAAAVILFFAWPHSEPRPKLVAPVPSPLPVRAAKERLATVAGPTPDPPRKTAPKARPVRAAAAEQPREVVTQFFPLLDVAPPFEGGELLRVTVPASTMRKVGLPVNQDRLGDRVYADVLVGQEGLARAIRFVSYEQ